MKTTLIVIAGVTVAGVALYYYVRAAQFVKSL